MTKNEYDKEIARLNENAKKVSIILSDVEKKMKSNRSK